MVLELDKNERMKKRRNVKEIDSYPRMRVLFIYDLIDKKKIFSRIFELNFIIVNLHNGLRNLNIFRCFLIVGQKFLVVLNIIKGI